MKVSSKYTLPKHIETQLAFQLSLLIYNTKAKKKTRIFLALSQKQLRFAKLKKHSEVRATLSFPLSLNQ